MYRVITRIQLISDGKLAPEAMLVLLEVAPCALPSRRYRYWRRWAGFDGQGPAHEAAWWELAILPEDQSLQFGFSAPCLDAKLDLARCISALRDEIHVRQRELRALTR